MERLDILKKQRNEIRMKVKQAINKASLNHKSKKTITYS
jgi:hypothetical protein